MAGEDPGPDTAGGGDDGGSEAAALSRLVADVTAAERHLAAAMVAAGRLADAGGPSGWRASPWSGCLPRPAG